MESAILLSGTYGVEPPTTPPDLSYYGQDAALHADRIPLDALVTTRLPLFVACTEFDPKRFQSEFMGLLRQRLNNHGLLPRSYIASGHNHFSISCHLGGSDTRLSNELLEFVHETCAESQQASVSC